MLEMVDVADAVWIATALLQRENPDCDAFTVSKIVARVEQERITGRLRLGVRAYATHHCVADRPLSRGRFCMLTSTSPNHRRLFRPGDPVHPARRGARQAPSPNDIPEKYRALIEWYASEYAPHKAFGGGSADPILELRGKGADLWADEDTDAYVDRLRSDR